MGVNLTDGGVRQRRDIRALVRGAILLISLGAIGYAIQKTGLASALTTDWIDLNIRGRGLIGEILFVAVGAAFTGVGLPRQIVSFMGGYAFGVIVGGGLALLATVFGCIAAFSYARLLGQKAILARAPRRIRKIDAFLARSPFVMALIIRLLPVGSNFLTCLAAGVSSIGAVGFISGSALGYIPQTLIFALIGSGASVSSETQIGVSIALFAVSAAVGLILYRHYGREVTVDDKTDAPAEGPQS